MTMISPFYSVHDSKKERKYGNTENKFAKHGIFQHRQLRQRLGAPCRSPFPATWPCLQ